MHWPSCKVRGGPFDPCIDKLVSNVNDIRSATLIPVLVGSVLELQSVIDLDTKSCVFHMRVIENMNDAQFELLI